MRGTKAVLIIAGMIASTAAWTQSTVDRANPTNEALRANESLANTTGRNDVGDPVTSATPHVNCNGLSGVQRLTCFHDQKVRAAAATGKPVGKMSKDGQQFNDTAAAAKAKSDAKDFAGAAAEYQSAIGAAPQSPYLHRLYAGMAIALREQAVAAFNSVQAPPLPAPTAPNPVIREYNAASAAVMAQRAAAALPVLRRAQEAAARAATLSQAQLDRAADGSIGVELRADASLFYTIDPAGTLATPRASAELEATWLRKWLAETPALAGSLVAKYGVATTATLIAKDPAAGLTLADEVVARTGQDVDGAIGYAQLVAAAKTPAGDPHRVKALTALNAVGPGVADGAKGEQIKRLKAVLSSTS